MLNSIEKFKSSILILAQTTKGSTMLNPIEKFKVAILHMKRSQIDCNQ